MSKESTYKIRIGKKLIPVNRNLYLYYYRSRRRLKYYEHDIKIEIAVRDDDGEIISFIPSKEDSLERLMGEAPEFAATGECMEDAVIGKLMTEKLRECLDLLTDEERFLIIQIYYNQKSEREMASDHGVSQPVINKRKNRILKKIRKMMEFNI